MNDLMRENLNTILAKALCREKTLACPSRGIIETWAIITLTFLLTCIPLALAEEAPRDIIPKESQVKAVDANSNPKAEAAMTQALDSQFSQDSLDFLNDSPTLSLSNEPAKISSGTELSPKPDTAAAAEPLPAALPDLKNPEAESAGEVAMLVSEQCSQNGTSGEGTNSCERVYSNGHRATVLTQNANEGDEIKSQTVVEEFDENHTLLYRKTIRHRVDYNYLKEQKAKEKEFFDIIYQPSGKKTTRELMVYEYYLDTGKTRSLSWTQYKQIGNEPKAGLAYNALLRYNADGSPERGLAEKWSQGKRLETFIDWNRYSRGYATLDQEAWGQWEGWIRNVSMQAYLP